jgi:hypothetical protein
MSDPRLYEWLALRRVDEGVIAISAGIYYKHGRSVPAHLTAVLDRLRCGGLIVIAEGDPIWDLRPISLTHAGQARYQDLCQQRAALQHRHESSTRPTSRTSPVGEESSP